MKRKAFTLIELLLVIGIISALAVAVFVALNPSQRMKDTRDSRRATDLDTILTALHEYNVDTKAGALTNMPAVGTEAQLGTGASGCTLTTGGCNAGAACADLMTGANNLSKYLKSMPIDPLDGVTYTAVHTGYSVVVDTNGLITVKACGTGTGTTEGTSNISASR